MWVRKAVIAQDEPVLRAEPEDVHLQPCPEPVVSAEAADDFRVLQALNRHAPDILFFDIHRPGPSGLDIARQASGKSHVAFVAAYDVYAIAAFEQEAVDYVMKSFTAATLSVSERTTTCSGRCSRPKGRAW